MSATLKTKLKPKEPFEKYFAIVKYLKDESSLMDEDRHELKFFEFPETAEVKGNDSDNEDRVHYFNI